MAKTEIKRLIYKIIENYLQVLRSNNLKFKKVYLFGSQVNGNFTENSDIDLAIVSDDFTGDIIDDRLLLMKLRREIDSRIEPHPFLSEEFTDENPFVKTIIDTGEEIKLL